ncbi:hypothetical protein [Streptomyces chiangmaiensis]|uniref:CRISPR system ring nuclease SSO1393-like domain-containing protein n=1 Tax=Streptomyces chiangmaiensis TaxID=766497 RepID=A0ABU7FN11_9ACTN|nr:hypothetical protein [Streptomyces chiangmaiensis]MED7825497.1 hypothetical protein [Streptomyces chiangmaiensis]
MTIHIVSVGSNLVDALKAPSTVRGLTQDQQDGIQSGRPTDFLAPNGTEPTAATADSELKELFGSATGQARDDLRNTVAVVRPGMWPAGISAELSTLVSVTGQSHLSREDVIVLLATDTFDGLTAALWDALALTIGDLDRIVYLSKPSDQPSETVHDRVFVVRVPGLDASTDEDFVRAMEGLGVLGRTLVRKVAVSENEDFLFHLSGGYKAAIPYLIGLAEGLRSLDRKGTVEAFVLHKDSGGKPIKLPLRRMVLSGLQHLLASFNANGERNRRPQGADSLEGYAFERREPSGYRLTAFGAGLRALIGPPDETVRQ